FGADLQMAPRRHRQRIAHDYQACRHDRAWNNALASHFLSRGRVGRRDRSETSLPHPSLQPAEPLGQASRDAGCSDADVPPVVPGETEESMSARDVILQAVRKNLPSPPVPLPEVAGIDHRMAAGLVIDEFRKQLVAMGGRWFEVADAASARLKVMELFPDAKVVCSTVRQVPGTRRVEE